MVYLLVGWKLNDSITLKVKMLSFILDVYNQIRFSVYDKTTY